jgi:glycosyltransferase involved in cell wall biosynthesis
MGEKRVKTIYPGVEIQATPSKELQHSIKQKYRLNSPYIISVGKQEPRKNMIRLISVYETMIKEKQIDPSTQLLIIGPSGWGRMEQTESSSIRFLGFVPDADLYALYQSAECLVFPSLYEGFGYPAVEAMCLGCPVVMSSTSSLAEIGADGAAALFDPHNEDSMITVLREVLSNEETQKTLVAKGKKRAQDFTWKNYYERMIEELSV